MKVESYLATKRIYLSRTTGGHLFQALDMHEKERLVTEWILPFVQYTDCILIANQVTV